jgi:hypothetical protein
MAEPKMNPNSQDQMMLMQSFEQLANAVGAALPMAVQSEIAAVKQGKRMSDQLQRMMAEGSMSFMNQLNPEMMPETEMSYEAAMGMTGASMTDAEINQMLGKESGSAISDAERRAIMKNKGAMGMPGPGMMPSQDGINYSPSSGVTMEPNVMSLDDAIAAGLVKPTRPMARPSAPMTSPRPRMRP